MHSHDPESFNCGLFLTRLADVFAVLFSAISFYLEAVIISIQVHKANETVNN